MENQHKLLLGNPKDIIIQYKGGSYSGCFWEYNYCAFDSHGEFTSIICTGTEGIRTEFDLLERGTLYKEDTEIYDLTNQESMLNLFDYIALKHVAIIVKHILEFDEDYINPKLKISCDYCEEPKDHRDIVLDDIYLEVNICRDCYNEHYCNYCDRLIPSDESLVDNEYACDMCETCYASMNINDAAVDSVHCKYCECEEEFNLKWFEDNQGHICPSCYKDRICIECKNIFDNKYLLVNHICPDCRNLKLWSNDGKEV